MKTSGYYEQEFASKREVIDIATEIANEIANNASGIEGKVLTFANLPFANQQTDKLWLVEQSSGVWLVNYKQAGIYKSDGTNWNLLDSTSDIINTLNNKADKLTTITTGNGLSGGGDLSANRTISHADTSTQANVVNTDGNVLQSSNVDDFGHVTSFSSINLDNRYALKNNAITGATKTKITYDSKGLITAGADATTSDIGEGTNQYFTQARARNSISVSSVGNSGLATYDASTGVIAVPNYGLGNSATATALQNARTINGVSFDGTANITIADSTKQPLNTNLTSIGAVANSAGLLNNNGTGGFSYLSATTTNISEGTNQYFTQARARTSISLTTTGNSGASTYNNTTGVVNVPNYTLAGLGGQAQLNGTGFVKASGTTISYDNSSYLPLTGGTLTGQLVSTRANNVADNSGQIYLNGATGNRIDFNGSGVGAPTFITRSLGTKIVFYPALGLSATSADYAMGIEGSTLWQGVPQNNSSHFFRWYAGTTNIMSLRGDGELLLNQTNDGAGFVLPYGGKIYKKVGGGIVIRKANNNTDLQVENNDGTNAVSLLTTQSGELKRTFTLPDTGSVASWIKLGEATNMVQTGAKISIKLVMANGYGAVVNQNQVSNIFFKTSNNISFQAGSAGNFFADGYYFVEAISQLGSPSSVRVVQVNNNTYHFFIACSIYTGTSHYDISYSGLTWVNTSNIATPSGNYIDLPKISQIPRFTGSLTSNTSLSTALEPVPYTSDITDNIFFSNSSGNITINHGGTYEIICQGNAYHTNTSAGMTTDYAIRRLRAGTPTSLSTYRTRHNAATITNFAGQSVYLSCIATLQSADIIKVSCVVSDGSAGTANLLGGGISNLISIKKLND